jgi:hypothetical protein
MGYRISGVRQETWRKNNRSGEVKTTANAELSQYSMSSDGSDPPSLSKANEISSEKA